MLTHLACQGDRLIQRNPCQLPPHCRIVWPTIAPIPKPLHESREVIIEPVLGRIHELKENLLALLSKTLEELAADPFPVSTTFRNLAVPFRFRAVY